MSQFVYNTLKEKQRLAKRRLEQLSLEEKEYLARVEAIIGYEIELLLPKNSKIVIGTDIAEQILSKIDEAAAYCKAEQNL